MRLFNAAVNRPEPIPLYAEMSAINPVILMENALVQQKEKIARDLSASVTLGAGQFCTNPGLVILVESEASKNFLSEFAGNISAAVPASMLNQSVYKAYTEGVAALQRAPELTTLSNNILASEVLQQGRPVAHLVKAADFLRNKKLSEEVFGPATLVVSCADDAELLRVIASLEGQLTATIHAEEDDEKKLAPILNSIVQKAGRVIYGGYPTGVEVCHAMQHGGPFPSTTDARSTSVGSAAIYRFVRPVAYQDFPDALLPEALQKSNPLNILRLADGLWTKDPG